MPLITPDLSESTQSGPVPDGIYKVRVESCEIKQTGPNSKNPGSHMANWALRIFGADGEMKAHNNRIVFYSTMLSGAGAGMLRQFVKVAAGKELKDKEPFDTDTMLSKELEIQVIGRINQDGTQSNYPNVKPIRGLNS